MNPQPLTLFIVDYWLPFPASEYGGVQIVAAESEAHCEQILADLVDDYYREQYPNYRMMIANRIKASKKMLADAAEAGIVYEFVT